MPSLERAPCDELVFDFPYQFFFFCVWLWAMAFISIMCMDIVRFLVRALRGRPWQSRTEAMRRWYGKGVAREGGNDRIWEP